MKNRMISIWLLVIGIAISYPSKAQINNPIQVDTSFTVFGACEQCKDRIELAVKMKGVSFAFWNVDSNLLRITFQPALISLTKIKNKVVAVGHDLVDQKANDQVYKLLPACCHYRETEPDGTSHNNHNPASHSEDSKNKSMVKGVVMQENNQGKILPLSNANVFWLGSGKGVQTDSNGVFAIQPVEETKKLVISYVGHKADTLTINDLNEVKLIMASNNKLLDVTVKSRTNGSFVSYMSTVRTQIMTGTELLKAACCNLSESFETNPSVDVSYNDAVTGSKQIQLLGLSGNYTQLTVENLPGPRGLATPLGLNSIAGPWIESIQLTKGVGSVANGYESIAGQINVELKKPEGGEAFLANVYINDFGKTDLNLNLSTKINSKWSSALLLHNNFINNAKLDFNNDGFRDIPTGNQVSIINRYKYQTVSGLIAQFGFKIMNDKKIGGEINYQEATDKFTTNRYGLGIRTERYEVFAKIGYVFPQQKYKSIGLQLNAINHHQDSYFGLTNYQAKQESVYGNLIYQSIITSNIHKYRTGLSFQLDNYQETFRSTDYKRKEIVPGAFFEYTYTPSDKISMVAGIRVDQNNLFGSFVTPRLNLRYEPISGSVFRFSAGRGQRTANIFAENNSVFVSSRQLKITASNQVNGYGLNPEIAWNKGISFDQKFRFLKKPATLSIDYFRNDFTNQVIVDLENTREVSFYNLTGKSYSNSFQAEINTEPISRLDFRIAYRYFNVKQTYQGQLLDRPFIAKHRAFASLDYATNNNWKFNYTLTYNGEKRITNTKANPIIFQMPAYSPRFFIMNAQITKSIGKNNPMDFYIGAENIADFYQSTSILAANLPFSNFFDASMVWGPTTGRMLYFGWRLKIKS